MHRKINNILAAMVIGLGFFMILAPYMPSLDFWVKKRSGFNVPEYALTEEDEKPTTNIPSDNRLAIPSIGLDEHIFISSEPGGVDKGVYQRPKTSDPSLGGNTVLVGHRFSYFPNIPAPFYHLDKIKIGDRIVVAWDGAVYRYEVSEVKIVQPTDISVEAISKEPKLTIYTCTPLWSARQRLVVVGKLLNGDSL